MYKRTISGCIQFGHALTGVFGLMLLAQAPAQRYDYQWPFGDGANLPAGFGISILNFQNQRVSADPYAEVPVFEMSNAGSFVCDAQGNLALMTNNCQIVDRHFQVITGGDSLTPGAIYNDYCAYGDYPSYQSSLFLPELGNDSVYYLLHKDLEIWDEKQDLVSRYFYLTLVVRKPDGSYYVRERSILLHTDMVTSRLTACIQRDGDRWWVWTAGYNTNRFYKFLIGGPEIAQGPFVQEIGVTLKNKELDIGQAAFSPDGAHLGIHNEAYGVLMYDFDNASGEMSNSRTLAYPNMHLAEGLVFSPDSRFLYLSTGTELYQMDLKDPDPSSAAVHLATIDLHDETGWPIGAGSMYLGPDCRIYISPGTTTPYIHAILQPNEKGPACQLEINAIRTPTLLEFDLPNLPMYRFNGQCDASIAWGTTTAREPAPANASAALIYPNPATAFIQLNLPGGATEASFQLLSPGGQCLRYSKALGSHTPVDVSGLNDGLYFWRVEFPGSGVRTGKLLVRRQE